MGTKQWIISNSMFLGRRCFLILLFSTRKGATPEPQVADPWSRTRVSGLVIITTFVYNKHFCIDKSVHLSLWNISWQILFIWWGRKSFVCHLTSIQLPGYKQDTQRGLILRLLHCFRLQLWRIEVIVVLLDLSEAKPHCLPNSQTKSQFHSTKQNHGSPETPLPKKKI